jgi:maspardin
MTPKIFKIIPYLVILVLVGVYVRPVPVIPFNELYASVDAETADSLAAFRHAYPPKTLEVKGVLWEYVALGQGPATILFLHGMTGAFDIWWQQMESLQDEYEVISVTYPEVGSLEKMDQAVMAIIAEEGVGKVHLVGTSLGGYFAQYIAKQHPDLILSLVLANTFPPNDIIAEKNKTIGAILPFLPEWLVMDVLRGSIQESVYPASNYSELVLAFGLEQTYGRMSKAQVQGRFRCVIQLFEAPDLAESGIPTLIIEADNDPLVEEALRKQLKETYPGAQVITLDNGHFPYLSMSDKYTSYLERFFSSVKLR